MTTFSLQSRAGVAAIAAGIFLTAVFICASSSWPIVCDRLLTDGLLTLAWIIAAFGIGFPFLRLFRTSHNSVLFYLSSIALGLGVMSLLVLGLGLAGWLTRPVCIAIILVGLALAIAPLRKIDLGKWATVPAGWGWLWLAVAPPAALAVVGALVPPGILWGDEPNGYDVVEYHLQVPRQWYDAGRITPLHENVFSYFPQGVEMHYLLAMELDGGPWRGMYLAQFMHVAMIALSIAGVASAGGTIAGVTAAVIPWITLLAPVAYVEGGVLLFGTLAIVWAMGAKTSGDMLIAGVMAGLSCGAKLTDVPMVLLAIPLAKMAAERKIDVKQIAVFLAAGILAFSPWLIRTWVWAGNPVFPEAMNWLGHAHFMAVQVERWRRAYLPTTGRAAALWGQILWDWRYAFAFFPAALAAGFLTRKSPATRFLLVMLALLAIVWLMFTHLQSRFLVLAIPIGALLIAQARQRILSALLICFMLACGLAPLTMRLAHYLDMDRQLSAAGGGLLGRENLGGLRGPDMASLPPDTRLDLVGDAGAFLYQVPMSRLRYRTVFDVDTSDVSKSIVEDWLAGPTAPQLNRLIVINPSELDRFSRTYYAIPPLKEADLKSLSLRPDVYIEGGQ